MFYDTNFKVRYYDIETELITKIKNRLPENADLGYNIQDVMDICSKLYKDELTAVFGAVDIYDSKLPDGFKFLEDLLNSHPVIKEIIDEMTQICINEIILENGSIENREEKEKDIREIIVITLFSQHLFHITHVCVCQLLETGKIDEAVITKLKKFSVDAFKQKPQTEEIVKDETLNINSETI
jgi:hypothetical protein